MRSSQLVCFIAMLLLQIIFHAHCTIHNVYDVVDFSNVDLRNFMYFKNLPSQNPNFRGQVNPFIEHFQKKKAILDYFDNLFFGNSPFTHESEIPFDPHFGRAWRPYYERKYGRRGKFLIEMLGKGHDLRKLKHYGAIPKEFGTIYYPN